MAPILLALLALAFVVVLYLKLKGSSGSASGAKGAKGSRPQVQVVAEPEPDSKRALILYGTQTGTVERFSKALGNELRRKYSEGVTVEERALARCPALPAACARGALVAPLRRCLGCSAGFKPNSLPYAGNHTARGGA
jgi:hypothetical protein